MRRKVENAWMSFLTPHDDDAVDGLGDDVAAAREFYDAEPETGASHSQAPGEWDQDPVAYAVAPGLVIGGVTAGVLFRLLRRFFRWYWSPWGSRSPRN